ncbi:hypothetical protein BGX30_008884, partial [Mortierella sp. GBA39]
TLFSDTMTIHPLKQVDHDAVAGDDPTFPAALGKEDQLPRSLDISKSKPKRLPTLPKISLGVFMKNIPKSVIKSKQPRPQQRITSTAALGKDDQLLGSLDISKPTSKPLPTLPTVSLSVFLKNVPKSVIKTKLPRPQLRIERTDQLVYCNSLLLQETLALSLSEQEPTLDKDELTWLTEIKNDPMERD